MGTFGEGPYLDFLQEFAVLVVFVASFILWRRKGECQRHSKKTLQQAPLQVFASAPPQEQQVAVDSPQAKIVTDPTSPSVGTHQAKIVADSTSPSVGTRQGASVPSTPHPCRQRHQPSPNSVGDTANEDEVGRRIAQAAGRKMLCHLEHKEFTCALNVFRALERVGRDRHLGENVYTAFVESAIRVGKLDVVERILRSLKRAKATPSIGFWRTLVKMLSHRKHFETCLSILEILNDQEVPTDRTVFSCLINSGLELGRQDILPGLLTKYADLEMEPTDRVILFRAYAALNDADASEAVFRKLGSRTTALMINLLLHTCVNAKQPERALRLLREARDLGSNVEEPILDVVSYNTVMKGLVRAGLKDQCSDCLGELITCGIQPDDITLSTILDACIAESDAKGARAMVDLVVGSGRATDTIICTLLIKGLVRANCLPRALELYEEMRGQDGAQPDLVTYSVLIKALVDRHNLARALELKEHMTIAGHRPDDIVFTHLLDGCRKLGQHDLGKRLFEEMIVAGVQPSEYSLVMMLKLQGRCGAHREARDLLETWEDRHGWRPSVIHYTCLVSGCLRSKCYTDAWAAYELMCRKGVEPDETLLSTLLPSMAAAQRWDLALVLARHALCATSVQPRSSQQRPLVALEALNSTLSQLTVVQGPDGPAVAELRVLMQAAGIPITTRGAKSYSPSSAS